jgi:hypothetical protein
MRTKILQLTETLTAFAAGARSVLSPGIPTDFPIVRLFLHVRGRYRVTVAGTATAAEAPNNIIERLRIYGQHRNEGTREILSMEGSDLWNYALFYGLVPPQAVGGGLNEQIGEYDFEVFYPISFAAELTDPSGKFHTILDAPSYDALQLDITWAALADFVTGGTTAFSDFGVTTGVPTVTILREVALLGENQALFNPGWVRRTFESVLLSSTGLTDGLITRNIPRGNVIRSIMLKQGTRAGASGLWTTVSNTILTRVRLKLSGQQIRDHNWLPLQQINRMDYAIVGGVQTGYGVIEFVRDGDLDDGLQTVDLPARGVELQLTGDVTSTANARFQVITTEIIAPKA